MFPTSEQLSKQVEAAMAFWATKSRGDAALHETIAKAIGVPYGSDRYGTVAAKVRERLLKDRGITLLAVPGVGYKLATCEEQARDVAADKTRRAIRTLRRGARHVAATPQGTSDHLDRLAAFNADSMNKIADGIEQSRKVAAALK